MPTKQLTKAVADCRDPKDNMYLELANEARASCIITGDKDLLDLHPYRGIAILTPKQFFDGSPESDVAGYFH
ncbi:MAG: putative toxin-antitoxin system toxin component, PIN family [Kiritimatiellae bacterium]|nr:putative toxin-antitoxin system toxin component, PIN family [Verrucomicrobiota bacterium]MBU4291518.1 putative toxin-antitoxin system toxin component, PIN family [Verrucomicrobiota bacterium]MCG2678649.1 putative toxin-antitoxin system toxin component, PIN family [Kiritimatiellia bacterium]